MADSGSWLVPRLSATHGDDQVGAVKDPGPGAVAGAGVDEPQAAVRAGLVGNHLNGHAVQSPISPDRRADRSGSRPS